MAQRAFSYAPLNRLCMRATAYVRRALYDDNGIESCALAIVELEHEMYPEVARFPDFAFLPLMGFGISVDRLPDARARALAQSKPGEIRADEIPALLMAGTEAAMVGIRIPTVRDVMHTRRFAREAAKRASGGEAS